MSRDIALIKLTIGTFGTGILLALSCIGTGVYIKDYFDNFESLQHWQKKLEQEKPRPKLGATATSSDVLANPRIRLHMAERRLASSKERLFTPIVMAVFFGGLSYLGWRGCRRLIRSAG